MSWGTVESMWSRPTLEDGHEQAIRYGVVLGWRADRLALNPSKSYATGENHPGGDCKALAARYTLGLAEKASTLVT